MGININKAKNATCFWELSNKKWELLVVRLQGMEIELCLLNIVSFFYAEQMDILKCIMYFSHCYATMRTSFILGIIDLDSLIWYVFTRKMKNKKELWQTCAAFLRGWRIFNLNGGFLLCTFFMNDILTVCWFILSV